MSYKMPKEYLLVQNYTQDYLLVQNYTQDDLLVSA